MQLRVVSAPLASLLLCVCFALCHEAWKYKRQGAGTRSKNVFKVTGLIEFSKYCTARRTAPATATCIFVERTSSSTCCMCPIVPMT